MIRASRVCAFLIPAAVAAVVSAQGQRPASQQPARDTPAQNQQTAPTPSGAIAGRVLVADTGRPVKRARVFVSAAELPGGRGGLTDDSGAFELTELPAGRYTLTVSKSGFVSLSYGQRRPLQAGTPLQLADGQQIKGIDFQLPRGSVIAGHVYDETGDAMPGILVRVMRYQYLQGERRLAPAGTAQTDDLGQYRIWGLNPGDYYVDAQARLNLGGFGGRGAPGGRGAVAGAIAGVVGAIGGGNLAALFSGDDDSQRAYAPTYYPGVTTMSEARPVTLGLSQEVGSIDFALQLVHVARIAGHVTDPDGTPTWSGNIVLTPDNAATGRGGFGMNYGSRIQWDGSFEIGNVPPGRYTLQARGADNDVPQFATQPVTVGDGDIGDLTIVLGESAAISGTLEFTPGTTDRPDVTQIRVTAPLVPQTPGGGPSQGRVEKDATFTVTGVQAGAHLIRPAGQLRGWTLKSVSVNGRDVTDSPMTVRSGERVSNVVITFTDKTSAITGTLTTPQGAPVTEYTVLAFSTDPTYWQPQSRQIATARPDQTGTYRIGSLPAGSYYVTTVDPAEQGEWFDPSYLEDHRIGAARIVLGDGETKTQDFKIRQ